MRNRANTFSCGKESHRSPSEPLKADFRLCGGDISRDELAHVGGGEAIVALPGDVGKSVTLWLKLAAASTLALVQVARARERGELPQFVRNLATFSNVGQCGADSGQGMIREFRVPLLIVRLASQ